LFALSYLCDRSLLTKLTFSVIPTGYVPCRDAVVQGGVDWMGAAGYVCDNRRRTYPTTLAPEHSDRSHADIGGVHAKRRELSGSGVFLSGVVEHGVVRGEWLSIPLDL
jgi:hypothetical protein